MPILSLYLINMWFFASTGGAVFVDREGKLTIHDSDFENSPEGKHTMQGDIMYSDGGVVVAR